jgi:hypothetical protein
MSIGRRVRTRTLTHAAVPAVCFSVGVIRLDRLFVGWLKVVAPWLVDFHHWGIAIILGRHFTRFKNTMLR